MKKAKKVAALCAAIAMAASSVMVMPAAADGTPTVRAVPSTTTIKAGESATISINFENNPGLVAWRMDLGYDSDAFKITGFTGTPWEKEVLDDFGNATTAKESIGTGPAAANPFNILWGDAIHGDYDNNGTVAEIKVTAAEDIQPGEYEFTLTPTDSGDFFNDAGEDVAFDFVPAKISVVVPVESVEVDPADYTFEKPGDTVDLTTVVKPEDATNKKVVYTSSDEKVATVDADGKITAVAEGSATITAASAEDDTIFATCKVTVPHIHNMKKVDAVAASCEKEGNNEYYVCDDCGKVFKDEEGTTETTVEAETIAKLPHTFDEVIGDNNLVSAATCVAPATYYKVCSVCGTLSDETFTAGEVDPSNHTGNVVVKDAKEATCTEEGYTGDTYCEDCGELITKGEAIPMLEHDYSAGWSHDDVNHWLTCTLGCGTIVEKAEHTFAEEVKYEVASEDVYDEETGEVIGTKEVTYEVKTCEICGHELRTPVDIPVPDSSSDESSDVSSDESSDVSSDESSDVSSDESSDVSSDESSDVSSDESSDVSSDESSDTTSSTAPATSSEAGTTTSTTSGAAATTTSSTSDKAAQAGKPAGGNPVTGAAATFAAVTVAALGGVVITKKRK